MNFLTNPVEGGQDHFSYCTINVNEPKVVAPTNNTLMVISRIMKAAGQRHQKSLKVFLGLGVRSMIGDSFIIIINHSELLDSLLYV